MAAPRISLRTEGDAGRVTVVRGDPDVLWADMQIEADGACVVHADTESGGVLAGDRVVTGCAAGDGVRLVHVPSNSLVYEHTF